MSHPVPRRALLLSALLVAVGAQAQDAPRLIEGQAFAGHMSVAGTELRLNGTGLRAVEIGRAHV